MNYQDSPKSDEIKFISREELSEALESLPPGCRIAAVTAQEIAFHSEGRYYRARISDLIAKHRESLVN